MKKYIILIWLSIVSYPMIAQNETIFWVGSESTYTMISSSRNWSGTKVILGWDREKKYSLNINAHVAHQFEKQVKGAHFDSYWNLNSNALIKVSTGFGEGLFLPKYDYTIELFQSISKTEISLGIRKLEYDASVNMIVGSLGRYWSSNWTSFRVSLRDFMPNKNNVNYTLTHRYYNKKSNYLEFKTGLGRSYNSNVETMDLTLYESMQLGIGYYFPFTDKRVKISYNFFCDDLSVGNRVRNEITFMIQK
jgi:YaiO family outer membrane protein